MKYHSAIQACLPAIEEIGKALRKLDYIEAISSADGAWIVNTRPALPADDNGAHCHVILSVRMKKAGKMATRKRWAEVAEVIREVMQDQPGRFDVFGSQVVESDYFAFSTWLTQGMIIISKD